MSKTIFMEKVGTGIRRIRKFCHENKNSVDIKPGDTYFSVEMKSPLVDEITVQNVGKNVGIKVGIKLTKNQQTILRIIDESPDITLEVLAEKVGIAVRSIERNIAILKEKGILDRIGSRKTGYWKIGTDELDSLKEKD